MTQELTAYVGIILIKNNKALFIHRDKTGWMDGYWALPGGGLDEGETLIHAVVRETQEELGISLDPECVKLVHTLHYQQNGTSKVGFYFAAHVWTGQPINKEPDKHSDLAWLPLEDLPINTLPTSIQALENYKYACSYSSYK